MKSEWKILLLLEFEWRIFRFYRKLINWLVRRKIRLTSPILCMINNGLDHCVISLEQKSQSYKKITGQRICYYKKDEI